MANLSGFENPTHVYTYMTQKGILLTLMIFLSCSISQLLIFGIRLNPNY